MHKRDMQLHPDSCPMEPMATGEQSYSVLSGRYSYKLLAKNACRYSYKLLF